MKALRKFLILFAILLILVFLAIAVHASPTIPAACEKHRATLMRVLGDRLGPGAPVAMFASQMVQESGCNSTARSAAGAMGLTQFMPATAQWIPALDSSLKPADPMNPTWAINAQVVYVSWLAKRNRGKTECDTYAFALSSYNGGEGWLRRDIATTRAAGADPAVWFGSVETNPDRSRAPPMIRENRDYPQRILYLWQPSFVQAAWGRPVVCTQTEDVTYESLFIRGYRYCSLAVAWMERLVG